MIACEFNCISVMIADAQCFSCIFLLSFVVVLVFNFRVSHLNHTLSLYILFWEISFKSLFSFLIGLFVFLLLSSSSSWCIWNNSPLSKVWFINIYPLFIGYLFTISCFLCCA
jgi:hypothetical protein